KKMLAMAEKAAKTRATDSVTPGPLMPFGRFLESVPPSVDKDVSDLWTGYISVNGSRIEMCTPDVRLHCPRCGGERTFRSEGSSTGLGEEGENARFMAYLCGDCREQRK